MTLRHEVHTQLITRSLLATSRQDRELSDPPQILEPKTSRQSIRHCLTSCQDHVESSCLATLYSPGEPLPISPFCLSMLRGCCGLVAERTPRTKSHQSAFAFDRVKKGDCLVLLAQISPDVDPLLPMSNDKRG